MNASSRRDAEAIDVLRALRSVAARTGGVELYDGSRAAEGLLRIARTQRAGRCVRISQDSRGDPGWETRSHGG